MIEDIYITDLSQLIDQLNRLPNNYMFRGHTNYAWKLESTLERLLSKQWNPENVEKFERYAIHLFKSKFNIYNSTETPPNSLLSWLAMMQHYGVPTRLLDFSTSPYVALYFAIEEFNTSNPTDFCIYAFDYKSINKIAIDLLKSKDKEFKCDHTEASFNSDKVFEETIDRFSYDIAWVTEPGNLNIRIDRQSGCFLICGNKSTRLNDVICSDIYKSSSMLRFVISKELYTHSFTLLRKMNINGKTIYGDLQGFGRSIKMELSIYSN